MIVSILIIFILVFVQFGEIGSPNCLDKSYNQYIYRSFMHQDLNHLSTNIFTLWNLSELEKEFTALQFIYIVTFLLVASTAIHFLMDKITRTKNCAIGFSGVLFGMLVFQLGKQGFDIITVGQMVLLLVLPSLTRTNISFTGHLSGVIAGILATAIF